MAQTYYTATNSANKAVNNNGALGVKYANYPSGVNYWTDGASQEGTGYKLPTQTGQYENYSRALGTTYNVNEYIPFYHNLYNLNTTDGYAQYQADRAEAENIRRYYEILTGYTQMMNNGLNATSAAYDKAAANSLQNLTSRGLTGTTILNNTQNQMAVNKANALTDAYNQNLQTMLNFMERRNTTANASGI